MNSILSFLLALPLLAQGISIPSSPPKAAVSIAKDLNSFSMEFLSFPLYAGTKTSPNKFSVNLLQNLANRTGIMPKIRVGGSTCDDAIYIANQSQATILHGKTQGTTRAGLTIGPSFFESYGTFPSARYIPGITLAVNGTNGTETRQAQAAGMLKALGSDLHSFEIGNEPDLYAKWHRRSSSWDAPDYVSEWQAARDIVDKASGGKIPYSAPSFGGPRLNSTGDSLAPLPAFKAGLNNRSDIHEIFGHSYMDEANSSGVTLQSKLMNHSQIEKKIAPHVALAAKLRSYCHCSYILGETNSLSGGGAAGLSNVFGAALWIVDYTLYAATQNITRLHFHQADGSPYSAWNPRNRTTYAPYYGHMMVAATVGKESSTTISALDLGQDSEYMSAYVVYADKKPARMVAINLRESKANSTTRRGGSSFALGLPAGIKGASVERLTAAGADATTNITLAGTSYEGGNGIPRVIDPAAANETAKIRNGSLSVEVRDSEAVLLHFL